MVSRISFGPYLHFNFGGIDNVVGAPVIIFGTINFLLFYNGHLNSLFLYQGASLLALTDFHLIHIKFINLNKLVDLHLLTIGLPILFSPFPLNHCLCKHSLYLLITIRHLARVEHGEMLRHVQCRVGTHNVFLVMEKLVILSLRYVVINTVCCSLICVYSYQHGIFL